MSRRRSARGQPISCISPELGGYSNRIGSFWKIRYPQYRAGEGGGVPLRVFGVKVEPVGPPGAEIEVGLIDGVIAWRCPVAASVILIANFDGGIEMAGPQLRLGGIDR